MKEINDTLTWIDENKEADVSIFEAKQKEIEGKLMPIMQAAYQGTMSNVDGFPEGIDPNMFTNNDNDGISPPPSNGRHNGPRVEEVD
jgi:L1 cell adhesion molecule like protein